MGFKMPDIEIIEKRYDSIDSFRRYNGINEYDLSFILSDMEEYDDKIINTALLLCIKEYETPPTPAHIIKMIERLNPKPQPTKLWAELVSALKKIDKIQDGWQYFSQEQKAKKGKECIEIYNSMPQETRDYVGSYAEMVRMSEQVFDNTFLSIEKSRFLKFIPEIRNEQQTKLIANNNLLLGEHND